jgi:DegV family protein with EDD domain
MAKVAIVTDSTTYFPDEMLRGLPVYIAPLQVIWGNEIYQDRIDIQPGDFYTRLKTAKVMPTTSQATPANFDELYGRLSGEGYDILSIHISSKLSGTLDSAAQARQHYPKARIELFDSETAAMALGYQVLAAARAAAEGATLNECLELARQAKEKTNVFFVVSTLEFLHRGGRIGGASAFVGTALNLKPILTLVDGRVEAVEKVRTMSKALDRLTELVDKGIGSARPVHLATLHANAPQEAQDLLKRVRDKFGVSDVHDAVVSEVSPVIGTHTGPGTVGLAYMAGM